MNENEIAVVEDEIEELTETDEFTIDEVHSLGQQKGYSYGAQWYRNMAVELGVGHYHTHDLRTKYYSADDLEKLLTEADKRENTKRGRPKVAGATPQLLTTSQVCAIIWPDVPQVRGSSAHTVNANRVRRTALRLKLGKPDPTKASKNPPYVFSKTEAEQLIAEIRNGATLSKAG